MTLTRKLRKGFPALLTALVFAASQTLAFAQIPEVPKPEIRPLSLEIPSELGTVEEYFVSADSPFIIHIQDAHSHPEAEEKIHEILGRLARNGPSLVVALEGAFGPLHPEYLDLFPEHSEVNEAIVRDLAAKGELSGAELFAWEEYVTRRKEGGTPRKDARVSFVGVEDIELYRENFHTYRTLLFRRDEIETLLAPLREKLELSQGEIFSPPLKRFVQERRRRKDGNYGTNTSSPQLAGYVSFLAQEAKRVLGIDLTEPIEQLRFPQLVRLLVLNRLERAVDRDRARIEKEKLVKQWRQRVQKEADPGVLETLEKIEWAQDPRAVAESAWVWAARHGVRLADFPNHLKTLGLTILQREIKSEAIFREMERLEKGILEKLIQREEERALVELLDDFGLFEKLLRLELTREEYQRVEERRKEIAPAAIRKRGGAGLPAKMKELESFFTQALHFYEGARARERVLLERTLRLVTPGRNGVLVTGGFHSSGLVELMKEKGIGYAVIRPRLGDSDGASLYEKVMRDEHTDLSPYLEGSIFNKQEALLLKSVLEKGIPLLAAKSERPEKDVVGRVAEAVNRHPVLSRKLQAVARVFVEGSHVRFVLKPRTLPSPPKGERVRDTSTIPYESFLNEAAAYDRVWSSPELKQPRNGSPRTGVGIEVVIDPAGRFRMVPLEVRKVKLPGAELETGPLEFLKEIGERAEVRMDEGEEDDSLTVLDYRKQERPEARVREREGTVRLEATAAFEQGTRRTLGKLANFELPMDAGLREAIRGIAEASAGVHAEVGKVTARFRWPETLGLRFVAAELVAGAAYAGEARLPVGQTSLGWTREEVAILGPWADLLKPGILPREIILRLRSEHQRVTEGWLPIFRFLALSKKTGLTLEIDDATQDEADALRVELLQYAGQFRITVPEKNLRVLAVASEKPHSISAKIISSRRAPTGHLSHYVNGLGQYTKGVIRVDLSDTTQLERIPPAVLLTAAQLENPLKEMDIQTLEKLSLGSGEDFTAFFARYGELARYLATQA